MAPKSTPRGPLGQGKRKSDPRTPRLKPGLGPARPSGRTATPSAGFSPRPSTTGARRALVLFRRRLLRWFARHGRDLPWRRTRDPYRVLVSEFMLQQTQVSRVLDYYPRFLARFPTLARLAAARPKAVMEAWEGMGYYARARNLHALARRVTREPGTYEGTLPNDPDELVKLPGIGRYTAGAVASFAYEKPVAAVDTNVARVIRRYFFGSGERRAGSRRTREKGDGRGTLRERDGSRLPAPGSREVWALASALVPQDGKRAWRFNQALMELGAVVCRARRPECGRCPVAEGCRSRRSGRGEKGEGRSVGG